MISSVFITRPKMAMVISLVLTLLGAIAYRALPVEQFPDIGEFFFPATVTIQADSS